MQSRQAVRLPFFRAPGMGAFWMRCLFSILAFGVVGSVFAQAPPAMPEKAAVCIACHGAGGNSAQPQYPVLAGQTSRYLYLQLKDYKEGLRTHELMTPMVADLTRDDMRDLAAYFSQQRPLPLPFKPDAEKARLGKIKADDTLCTMCHLGKFAGQNEVPKVANQYYEYVVKQLADFKARRRTNDAGSMTSVAGTLSDADIENLGHYLAGL